MDVYAGLQTETNSRKIIAIHLLVAYSFIPKTYEDIMLDRNDINHINCFKNDPRVCNLQWVSREENNRYSILMHENEYIVHKPFNIDKDIKYWGITTIIQIKTMKLCISYVCVSKKDYQ